jgi:hypothetical protein
LASEWLGCFQLPTELTMVRTSGGMTTNTGDYGDHYFAELCQNVDFELHLSVAAAVLGLSRLHHMSSREVHEGFFPRPNTSGACAPIGELVFEDLKNPQKRTFCPISTACVHFPASIRPVLRVAWGAIGAIDRYESVP